VQDMLRGKIVGVPYPFARGGTLGERTVANGERQEQGGQRIAGVKELEIEGKKISGVFRVQSFRVYAKNPPNCEKRIDPVQCRGYDRFSGCTVRRRGTRGSK